MDGRKKFYELGGINGNCDFCDNKKAAFRYVEARDVFQINHLSPRHRERTGYDTQKPKELLRKIIKASSNTDDLVADFFCGSGTTLTVAKELNRKFIGCDINEKACEIAAKRIEQERKQLKLF